MELSKCPLCGGGAGRTRTKLGFYRCYCCSCGTKGPIAGSSDKADELWNYTANARPIFSLSVGEVKACPWDWYAPSYLEDVFGKRIVCEYCGASTEAMLNDDDLLDTWNGSRNEGANHVRTQDGKEYDK